jgi:septin family protein
MSFNLDKLNMTCSTMYNSQNTNQVLGYMCSPKKSIEGFQNAGQQQAINSYNNALAPLYAQRTQMERAKSDFQNRNDQQGLQGVNSAMQNLAGQIQEIEKKLAEVSGNPITTAPASMSGPAPGNNANTQKLAMFNSDPQVKQMMDDFNRQIANKQQQITQYNNQIDQMVNDINRMIENKAMQFGLTKTDVMIDSKKYKASI